MTTEEARQRFEEAKELTDDELEEMCRVSELLSDIVIDIALEKKVDNSYGNCAN